MSFIISQQNNIPRIRKTIKKLCSPFGDYFPSIEKLKKYTENNFLELGIGYRAKYLLDLIAKGINLDYLEKIQYSDMIKCLKEYRGIGDKVANCIALYGFARLEAFPRDIWINRVINNKYSGVFKLDSLAKCGGIVQQYMFFYERNLNMKESESQRKKPGDF